MIYNRSLKKALSLSSKLLLITVLWLGGVYAFEWLNKSDILPHTVTTGVNADGNINLWWPTQGAKIGDTQTFKAMVQDKNVSDYTMSWSVDNGQMNSMYDSYTDHPHKEAVVDLKSWTWRGSGPYKITFKALDKNNNSLGETSIEISTPDAPQGPVQIEAASSTLSASVGSALLQAAGVPVASAQAPAPTQQPQTTTPPAIYSTVSVIAPTSGSTVGGVTVFSAKLDNSTPDSYKMSWKVDNGGETVMNNVGDHKEASVDVSTWNWKGSGPYAITFVVRDNSGNLITTKDTSMSVGSVTVAKPALVTTSPTVSPTDTQKKNQTATVVNTITQAVTAPVQAIAGNPISGQKLYVNPNNEASQVIKQWQNSRPADAEQLKKIANGASVTWLGGWNWDITRDVQNAIKDAQAQGAMPVFVAYNIPGRDCGQYSAGGVGSADEYRNWIRKIADAIGGNKAAMIIEPDGTTLTDCLGSRTAERFSLIKDAVSTFKSKGNISVYIDAGHPGWITPDDMANRLKQAGIAQADGFALNTSNFVDTQKNIAYGTQVSDKVGGKHFVIDTGRNGLGSAPNNEWCNPWGRALGAKPTTNTGYPLVDAFLWVKGPGGSDGNCNGGPNAGEWWPEYALDIAKRSAY
ncbi:MAG: glycoside hydrolase family 6 protein [Patescibacteria group bacterium]